MKQIFKNLYSKINSFLKNHPAWFCFIFFTIIGVWQFQEGLFDYKNKLYIGGEQNDSIGYINNIEAIKTKVKEQGFSYLISGEEPSNGLNNLGEKNIGANTISIWKIYFYILSLFFNSNLVWNITQLFFYLAIACSGYLLAREVGISPFFSILVSYFLVHLETFEIKFNNHIDLANYCVPILLIWSSLKLARQPTRKNFLILAIMFPLFFTIGAYYSYFGFFFSLVFIISYWIIFKKYKELISYNFLINSIIFICISLALFSFLFPTIVGSYLQSIFTSGTDKSNISLGDLTPVKREFGEYNYWSLNNIFSIFQTGFTFLRSFFPFTQINNIGAGTETVYRIGFIIVLLLIVLHYYFNSKYNNNKVKFNNEKLGKNEFNMEKLNIETFAKKEIYIWFLSMFVMLGFAVNDSYFFSLVKFSYSIIPSFRVGIRALIYFDICVVVLVFFYLDKLNKIINFKNKNLIFAFLILVTYFDFIPPGDPIYPKIYEAKLKTEKSAYLILSEKPKGILLELPMASERVMPLWENEYLYSYFQAYHKKILVNPLFDSNLSPVNGNINWLRETLLNIWNNMNETDLELLRQAGIRYISIHPTRNIGIPMNFTNIINSNLLNKISSDSFTIIFEFKDFIEPSYIQNENPKNKFLNFMKESYKL